jgi:hypothetical protein
LLYRPSRLSRPIGIPYLGSIGTKSRATLFGGTIKASAERAKKARKEVDRLACEVWNDRMQAARDRRSVADALKAS